MLPPTAPAPRGFSRRALLAASAGLALAATGCTSGSTGAPEVSTAETDQLAGQVAVQETVVAAYASAAAADPTLGAEVGELATQAGTQLERLRAAAPSAGPSTVSSSPSGTAPPAGADVRGWLRSQVGAAARSHADAGVDQTGARAALLGSLAAGLRGHEAALA
ncbi:hypothetical protein [Geodermatophilus sabuli]|uniref:DUF4439 domain-containing protein n=1 Tax=Geodermatophilus sabuli TaxID=1564158 RepID=A0A285EJ26_9ACTN|nr:hypothetical protein [Geodermatophilus sabuli]MBB3085769.1 hypothetical protein [Geodermatophilus sabuli]SNX99020.1 hypothetical protein SAMN06893097_113112 [Geodermatophilus sabuli]